jgi:hypothetical protein
MNPVAAAEPRGVGLIEVRAFRPSSSTDKGSRFRSTFSGQLIVAFAH